MNFQTETCNFVACCYLQNHLCFHVFWRKKKKLKINVKTEATFCCGGTESLRFFWFLLPIQFCEGLCSASLACIFAPSVFSLQGVYTRPGSQLSQEILRECIHWHSFISPYYSQYSKNTLFVLAPVSTIFHLKAFCVKHFAVISWSALFTHYSINQPRNVITPLKYPLSALYLLLKTSVVF